MHLESENVNAPFILLLLTILIFVSSQQVFADCESSLKLEGVESIKSCAPDDKGCIPASKAIYDYSQAMKDDPNVFTITTHASPWHLYDGTMRILTVEELAAMIKPLLHSKEKRVDLIASWTGVAPDPNGKSLAQKLSDLLGGFPVNGMDGFVWLSKDGSVRTTHQAFTIKPSNGPYAIHPGDEVMVSYAEGWMAEYEQDFAKSNEADALMRAGAAWEIYYLCQDKALRSFEAAAKLSNPIAAYNAALIHLERGKADDLKTASALLAQAAARGDEKSKALLKKLQQQKR